MRENWCPESGCGSETVEPSREFGQVGRHQPGLASDVLNAVDAFRPDVHLTTQHLTKTPGDELGRLVGIRGARYVPQRDRVISALVELEVRDRGRAVVE